MIGLAKSPNETPARAAVHRVTGLEVEGQRQYGEGIQRLDNVNDLRSAGPIVAGVEGHPDLSVYQTAKAVLALLGNRGQEKPLRFFTLYQNGAEEED